MKNKCVQVFFRQESERNVEFRAGLTGAVYGLAFIFEEVKENRNRLHQVCVAGSDPRIKRAAEILSLKCYFSRQGIVAFRFTLIW